jgi:hypothetical protein
MVWSKRGVVDEPADQEELCLRGEASLQVKAQSDHGGDCGVSVGVVVEKGGVALSEWCVRQPLVQPEGRGAVVHDLHTNDDAIEGEAFFNDLLQKRWVRRVFPQVMT